MTAASAAAASSYPAATVTAMLIILLLTASVWIGGWVVLWAVGRSTSATLPPPVRVEFFRHFGRFWGVISSIDLAVALAAGLILLLGMRWTALSTWCVILAAVLVATLIAGISQARSQRRLRQRLVSDPSAGGLREKIARRARAATILRLGLGALSIATLVLAVLRVS